LHHFCRCEVVFRRTGHKRYDAKNGMKPYISPNISPNPNSNPDLDLDLDPYPNPNPNFNPTQPAPKVSVTNPKPPIIINRTDVNFEATKLHFKDLIVRYGSPVVCVDLVKQVERRPRESLIGSQFREAVDVINDSLDSTNQIRYCALDYARCSKKRPATISVPRLGLGTTPQAVTTAAGHMPSLTRIPSGQSLNEVASGGGSSGVQDSDAGLVGAGSTCGGSGEEEPLKVGKDSPQGDDKSNKADGRTQAERGLSPDADMLLKHMSGGVAQSIFDEDDEYGNNTGTSNPNPNPRPN